MVRGGRPRDAVGAHLATVDRLDEVGTCADERAALRERLVMYRELADARVQALRRQLATADASARSLADRLL